MEQVFPIPDSAEMTKDISSITDVRFQWICTVVLICDVQKKPSIRMLKALGSATESRTLRIS